MAERFAVAIDGPAGAGKSTVARAVAERLGLQYLDTGMMYRAVTRALLDRGVDVGDPEAVGRAVEGLRVSVEAGRVYVDGEDLTDRIRSPEVNAAVSAVAAVRQVREAMVRLQRAIAEEREIVMDGRDIGSVVLPGAACKIYLDAAVEERARRRLADYGWPPERLPEVVEEVRRRDFLDSTRAESPLVRPADAVVVDTTGLSRDEVVERVVAIVRERRDRGGD